MKLRMWRWIAVFAAGGMVLQTTTTSCTEQATDQFLTTAISLAVQAAFQLLLSGIAT